MLHRGGQMEEWELEAAARGYIFMYAVTGEDVCLVPFKDLDKGRKRFVKFQKLAEQWCFVDLVDK